MAVYLDENEEASRRAELEEYKAERSAAIEEERINAKNKRMKGDQTFRRVTSIIIFAVFAVLVIRWLM